MVFAEISVQIQWKIPKLAIEKVFLFLGNFTYL